MSNIRLFGILAGIALAIAAFLYFRGRNSNRSSLLLAWGISCALLFVSINPDGLAVLRDAFDLGHEYGRLLALLILSNFVLFLLLIYQNSKVEALKLLIDRSMRATSVASIDTSISKQTSAQIMIIIPALNEGENLKILIPKIPKTIKGFEVGVLVVDDGSSDDTADVARQLGCIVARFPVNRGQGAASRVGYSFLEKNNVLVGVTMDADNQHQPSDLAALVEPILAGQYDLVIGSRILGSADQDDSARRLGVTFFSRLASMLAGVRITDCSSGFKAFNINEMAKLDLRQDQFQSSEVIIAAARKGLRIGEVPIHVARRDIGQSRKGTNLVYGVLFLKAMARTWLR